MSRAQSRKAAQSLVRPQLKEAVERLAAMVKNPTAANDPTRPQLRLVNPQRS